jgi:hypothetical protein
MQLLLIWRLNNATLYDSEFANFPDEFWTKLPTIRAHVARLRYKACWCGAVRIVSETIGRKVTMSRLNTACGTLPTEEQGMRARSFS